MITYLHIVNYALIRDLTLEPGPRFNIITGETGAGKSIILGALGLLRGNRADMQAVRNQAEKSIVEAHFALDEPTRRTLKPILERADAYTEGDDATCILRREILPSGRSRAFINDTPVNLGALAEVSDRLIDIHSQHKNLLLSDAGFQLRVLDSLADNQALLADYRERYTEFRAALKEYTDARTTIERTRADADYLKYQLDELDNLAPAAGEDEDLRAQRDRLSANEATARALTTAADALSWGECSALVSVDRALEALQDIEGVAADIDSLAERLVSVKAELSDIADTVAAAAGETGDAPAMIEQIDSRLSRLDIMTARHKVASSAALVEIRDSLARRLEDLGDADNILGELEKAARARKRAAMQTAETLSQRRRAAAADLEAQLREVAAPLGLNNLVVDIDIEHVKLNADGCDAVDFRFAFNKNQQPSSIGATASGGEISRVMLALKSILADRVNLPTIIFDEIDTGVSGDIAARMGDLMARIAGSMQVITITHLPAVAARGDRHFKVFKRDNEVDTETFVTPLDREQRIAELATMLGGDPADHTAVAAAKSMLKS